MVRDPDSGKCRRTRLFVMMLGYSRKSIRLLVFRSSSRVWAELHEKAFRRLGGTPRIVVLDTQHDRQELCIGHSSVVVRRLCSPGALGIHAMQHLEGLLADGALAILFGLARGATQVCDPHGERKRLRRVVVLRVRLDVRDGALSQPDTSHRQRVQMSVLVLSVLPLRCR